MVSEILDNAVRGPGSLAIAACLLETSRASEINGGVESITNTIRAVGVGAKDKPDAPLSSPGEDLETGVLFLNAVGETGGVDLDGHASSGNLVERGQGMLAESGDIDRCAEPFGQVHVRDDVVESGVSEFAGELVIFAPCTFGVFAVVGSAFARIGGPVIAEMNGAEDEIELLLLEEGREEFFASGVVVGFYAKEQVDFGDFGAGLFDIRAVEVEFLQIHAVILAEPDIGGAMVGRGKFDDALITGYTGIVDRASAGMAAELIVGVVVGKIERG